MDRGKILIEGAPADLVRQHVGSEIVEVEKSDEVLACLAAHNIQHEVIGDIVQVATGSSREIARLLLEECTPHKVLTRLATLEDVFLKLTGRMLRD
jgi:lipooligosaccharide transport system ATP-binding protein